MSDNNFQVVNDADHDRFVIEQEDRIGQLVYEKGNGRLVLVHTEVPESLGGQGIGGRLVRAAADHAIDEGLTVAPWCPFARKWLEDHPEVADNLTIDWSPPGLSS